MPKVVIDEESRSFLVRCIVKGCLPMGEREGYFEDVIDDYDGKIYWDINSLEDQVVIRFSIDSNFENPDNIVCVCRYSVDSIIEFERGIKMGQIIP